MSAIERFDQYMAHLSGGLWHLDRHAGLKGYCMGLMLPLARKSVEPMAARVDPLRASARHQASGTASIRRQGRVIRRGNAAPSLPVGRAQDGLHLWRLVDHR